MVLYLSNKMEDIMELYKRILNIPNICFEEVERFEWNCFPNTFYFDGHSKNGNFYSILVSMKTFDVYEIECLDGKLNATYKWVNPEHKEFLDKESERRNAYPDEVENVHYLEVEDDVIEKMEAIVNDREYDTRIMIPLDFTDEEFIKIAKAAHEKDITINKFIEMALEFAMKETNENN